MQYAVSYRKARDSPHESKVTPCVQVRYSVFSRSGVQIADYDASVSDSFAL